MARAMLAMIFAVVMTALTVLPGTSTGPTSAADGSPVGSVVPQPTFVPPVETTLPDPSAPMTDPLPPAPDPTTEPTTEPVAPEPTCFPDVALVDPEATPEATCLAETLDRWRSQGSYGIGQQLNVSSSTYFQPVARLSPERPALVGFDLEELELGETYGFGTPPLTALLDLASQGVLLTASWHTANPSTGGDSYDRRWQDLRALLEPGRPEYDTFWADVDRKIELLERFQTGDDGRFPPAAVLFRPLHEANGDWFWWAQGTDPALYRQLYSAIQDRVAAAGVHNVVWGWSANARNADRIIDPLTILPDRVDLAGVDSYEPMAGRTLQDRQLNLSGLAELAGRVPRVAVTEAGPHGSKNGQWDPSVVAPSATAIGVRPAYVMMWFDDGNGDDGYTGKKQLSSLRGGEALVFTCPAGVCSLS